MLAASGLAAFSTALPSGAAPTCVPAGGTGLTAVTIAQSGATITGAIDATGCDLGVYIGPGANGVTINGATISGANDHAILADNVANLTISGNTIKGNGIKPNPNVTENKAIQLDGVTNSTVSGNTLSGNIADGGVGIADYGALDPGAPKSVATGPVATSNVTVSNNTLSGDRGGCEMVIAGYNAGGGATNVTASGNHISDVSQVGQFGPAGPEIGQIVLAGDAPGVPMKGNTITGNTIIGGGLPGVIVHANAPGDTIDATMISNNTFSLDNWLDTAGPPQPTAIGLRAEAPVPPPATPSITNTTITGNTISNEYYGIWSEGNVTGTTQSGNTISVMPGGTAVFNRPAHGTGGWVVGSNGTVYALGNSPSYGSAAGASRVVGIAASNDGGGYWVATSAGQVDKFGSASLPAPGPASLADMHVTPARPIVAFSATPNPPAAGPNSNSTTGQGYWLVGSDGGVFNFGDANFYGSTGNLKLAAPIVGMASSPDGFGYWLVGSDGGVFSFGDAGFHGSMGGKHLNKPIVGIVSSPSGNGYWLIAADGGTFNFGDAPFIGSLGNLKLAAPIVGARGTLFAPGLWLVAADGGTFTFGAATFFGSAAGKAPIGTITGLSVN
ncbi:MAG TPA: right-handed parallel beta-helix repeat-containing protein [Acidimicrobiales bacterium]|nr:right-handed parallel beta-helix repeat-containing protein [Acidimicrobiales bacterium]